MEVIKKISHMIEDEIEGIKCYAKLAAELKDTYPEIAENMYRRSLQEEEHMKGDHDDVVRIIERYRRENGDPPQDMMAVYNYLHQEHIDAYAKAKAYQEVYKTK